MTRLIDEWRTGTNRFDKPGERILIAAENGKIVGNRIGSVLR